MIVCNSTVMIYLAKIGRLALLNKLFKHVYLPSEVKRETVDEGKKRNHIDAFEIERSIKEGWIKVESVEIEPILKDIGIDKGEAEAISLSHKKKFKLLLDQTHARNAAGLLNIEAKGTIYVLLLALQKGLIDYNNYLSCLLDLVRCGFRMSEEVYIEAIRLGKKMKK